LDLPKQARFENCTRAKRGNALHIKAGPSKTKLSYALKKQIKGRELHCGGAHRRRCNSKDDLERQRRTTEKGDGAKHVTIEKKLSDKKNEGVERELPLALEHVRTRRQAEVVRKRGEKTGVLQDEMSCGKTRGGEKKKISLKGIRGHRLVIN